MFLFLDYSKIQFVLSDSFWNFGCLKTLLLEFLREPSSSHLSMLYYIQSSNHIPAFHISSNLLFNNYPVILLCVTCAIDSVVKFTINM
jgi:hypothetical protein